MDKKGKNIEMTPARREQIERLTKEAQKKAVRMKRGRFFKLS